MAKGDRNAGWPGFFRAFTVLCALMLLLAQSGQEAAGASAAAKSVFAVYEALTCWTIPALFLLWGMFALEDGRSGVSSSLLGLALPAFLTLVFWGALYAVVSHLLGGGVLSWGGVWSALVSAAKGNTYFHLWVLYPLIGLYLVHPVIARFTASATRGEVLYFLALCLLFAGVLPLWTAFRPGDSLAALLERLRVHLVLGWAGCYVGGWYLRHYEISRASEFILYILGVLGLALSLTGDRIFGGGKELWQSYTAPNVLFTAAAFCVLFRYVLGISEERSRRRAVYELGVYSFGIYLFHQLWALVFRWFGITVFSLPAAAAIPVFALAFFLLSFPFAWLFSLIPGSGRYL